MVASVVASGGGMTEFLLRMRSDRLAPNIQNGDTLSVRETFDANLGQLVVVAGPEFEARVEEWDGESQVIGVVTNVYRRLTDG